MISNPETLEKHGARIPYLDGLRGIAAIIVMYFHCILAFSPNHPIAWYIDGQLMVAVFFVMSGYVLTDAYSRATDHPANRIASRIIRLYAPAISAFFLATIIDFLANPISRTLAKKTGWHLLGAWSNHPSLAIRVSDLAGTFVGYKDSGLLHLSTLIPLDSSVCVPLWTISYELLGSILIITLTQALKRSYPTWIAVVISGVLVFGIREIGLFIIGHLLRQWSPQRRGARYRTIASCSALLGFVAINHLGWDFHQARLDATLSGLLNHPSPVNALKSAGGALIVAFVLAFRPIQAALESRPATFLGGLSFPIYLVHWPIVVGAGSIMYAQGHKNPNTIFLCSLVIVIPYALLFSALIDKPAIRISRTPLVLQRRSQSLA